MKMSFGKSSVLGLVGLFSTLALVNAGTHEDSGIQLKSNESSEVKLSTFKLSGKNRHVRLYKTSADVSTSTETPVDEQTDAEKAAVIATNGRFTPTEETTEETTSSEPSGTNSNTDKTQENSTIDDPTEMTSASSSASASQPQDSENSSSVSGQSSTASKSTSSNLTQQVRKTPRVVELNAKPKQAAVLRKLASTENFQIGNSLYPRVDMVDVSSHQSWMTQSSFNTLKAKGVKGAIVKLTQGTGYVSPSAGNQLAYAKAAGMTISGYHFATFSSVSTAQAEARHFVAEANALGLSKSTPMVADVEMNYVTGNYSTELAAFWNVLSAAGYTNHVGYTSLESKYNPALTASVGGISHMWIAQYPYSPRAANLWNTSYGAWQFASTAYLGSAGPIDVSIDYHGLFTGITYDTISNQQSVAGTAIIAGAKAGDGLFASGPFYTSASTSTPSGSALSLNGQVVHIVGYAQTARGSWAQIKVANGSSYWLDRKLLTGVLNETYGNGQYDKISDLKSASGTLQVTGATGGDGLFSGGPFFTSETTTQPAAKAQTLNGQKVGLIATARTARGVWSEIKTNSGLTYWIDSNLLQTPAVVHYDTVNNQKAVTGQATITGATAGDGLFVGGPFYTSEATSTPSASAKSLNGQTVSLLSTATTSRGNWTEIKTKNGSSYWLDSRLVGANVSKYDVITNQQSAHGNYKVVAAKQGDGLFVGGPFYTSQATSQPSGSAKSLNDQTVSLIATATTSRGGWAEIKTSDGYIYWLDSRLLQSVETTQYDSVTDQRAAVGKAKISGASAGDGLFVGGPFYTSLATSQPSGSAQILNNQIVNLMSTATTSRGSWVEVKTSAGKVYWLDQRLTVVQYDTVMNKVSVTGSAIVSGAGAGDGLFVGGPFYTSQATSQPSGTAKNLNGQTVVKIATATTSRGNWTQIKTAAGQLYWLDSKLLK